MLINNQIVEIIRDKIQSGKKGYGKILIKVISPLKDEGFNYDAISRILLEEYSLEISASKLRQFNSRNSKKNITKNKENEKLLKPVLSITAKENYRNERDKKHAQEAELAYQKLVEMSKPKKAELE